MPEEPAVLAIEGGSPLRTAPWPQPPIVEPADDPEPVALAEAELAERLGLPGSHVVACASADEAYRAALDVIPRHEGGGHEEIVMPAILAEQAARAARAAGWRIVPSDLEADTGAISVRGLARALSDRTAGAVVVHAFGHPAVMSDVLRVAQDRGLAVVEDASGALGASFRGAPVGRMGQAAVLVGRAGDPLTRGAFAIFAERATANAARESRGEIDKAEASAALAELRRLDQELVERQRLAWELTFDMRGMKAIAPMAHGRWIQHAYACYVVRLRGILWKRPLDETIAAIRAEGVECEAACGPSLHLDAAVAGALPDDPRVGDDAFPVALRLPNELIAIPLHSNLTSKDMDEVAAVLRKVEARSI